jgi:hypothetical protein
MEAMMKKLILIALAGIAGASIAAQPAGDLSPKDESELARALGNRVAGPPTSCVHQRDIRSSRSIGDGLIVFQGRNNSIVYLNEPRARCAGLTRNSALITRTYSTKLCAGDIAEIVEPVSGAGFGSCVLGDFTPYRR